MRIKHYGFNELPETARRSLLLRFINQLTYHGSWGCLNGHHIYDFVNIHRYYFCHHSC
ncbi:MAG: hypothetical protein KME50_30965 [Nostoc desertorum CM1-VF14]|nr:hypothetical protein [Nostoc desertorum CM1-VF14]